MKKILFFILILCPAILAVSFSDIERARSKPVIKEKTETKHRYFIDCTECYKEFILDRICSPCRSKMDKERIERLNEASKKALSGKSDKDRIKEYEKNIEHLKMSLGSSLCQSPNAQKALRKQIEDEKEKIRDIKYGNKIEKLENEIWLLRGKIDLLEMQLEGFLNIKGGVK